MDICQKHDLLQKFSNFYKHNFITMRNRVYIKHTLNRISRDAIAAIGVIVEREKGLEGAQSGAIVEGNVCGFQR